MTSRQPSIAIMISYSRTDSKFVDLLEPDLRKHGYTTWVERRKLEAGQHWDEIIQRAIDSCDIQLVVLSPAALASPFVRKEYHHALKKRKIVIPVRFHPTPSLPRELQRLQYADFPVDVDFKETYPAQLARLLSALAAHSVEIAQARAEAEKAEAEKAERARVEAERQAARGESQRAPRLRGRWVVGTLSALCLIAVVAAGLYHVITTPPAPTPYRGAGTANDVLTQVVADPSGGLWAVGQHYTAPNSPAVAASFILRYTNGAWEKVYSTSTAIALESLAMVSPTEGWAVGSRGTILHGSGGTWTQVAASPTTTADLRQVALTASGSEAWGVGGVGTILHYSGGAWTTVASPTEVDLDAVAVTASGGEAWAVGDASILHYDVGNAVSGSWDVINGHA